MGGLAEVKKDEKPDEHALIKGEMDQTLTALREYFGRIGKSQHPSFVHPHEWKTQLNIRLEAHIKVVNRLLTADKALRDGNQGLREANENLAVQLRDLRGRTFQR
ncbi:MAG: hypothetical protein Q8L52_01315 [bacterium]|nr:hypothetical protein [bacterium]